jgi:hypothetical protein
MASAPRRERPAAHLPQRTAPVYRGQRAPTTLSTLPPPVLHGRSSHSQLACGKSTSPARPAMPRRFPLDLREQNAVACPSAFIQIRASTARQAAGEAPDDAREGSTEHGGVGKRMQLAAPGTDVHVTSMRRIRAVGGLAWRSRLALNEGSQPGADKHTAAGRRLASGRGMAGGMVCGVVCVAPEEGVSFPAEGFELCGARGDASFFAQRRPVFPSSSNNRCLLGASGDERKHRT